MLDSLYTQFAQLPDNVRAAVTSPEAMAMLDGLEKKYRLPLGELVLRIMVGELPLAALPTFLRDTEHMEGGKADALIEELQEGLLHPVLPQLAGRGAKPAPQPLPPANVARPPASLPVANKPVPPQPAAPRPASPDLVAPVRQRLQRLQAAVPQAASRPVAPAQSSYSQAPTAKQAPARPVAAYFVHAEDEEEIQKHRERLQHAGASPTDDLESTIGRLQERYQLSFPSPNLEKRFHLILLSRLRDVRDTASMRDLLTRPEKIGGLALAPEVADALAQDVEAAVRALHERARQAPPTTAQPALPGAAPAALRPSEITVLPLDDADAASARMVQGSRGVPAPAVPSPALPAPAAPSPLPPLPPAPPPLSSFTPVQPVAAPEPTVVRRTVAPSMDGRQLMQDVKHPVRPMSLVDELEVLTLEDFRSPSRTVVQTAQKILEKIGLLAEESFAKRSQGVGAWRRSQVHQLYLAMGRDSMERGVPIERIVEERQRAGQQFLTPDEFAIVADLNRQLSM